MSNNDSSLVRKYSSPLETVAINVHDGTTTSCTEELIFLFGQKLRNRAPTLIACTKNNGAEFCIYNFESKELVQTIMSPEEIHAVAFISQDELVIQSGEYLRIWNFSQQRYTTSTDVGAYRIDHANTLTVVGDVVVAKGYGTLVWKMRTEEHKIVNSNHYQDICKFDNNHYFECDKTSFALKNAHTNEDVSVVRLSKTTTYRSCDMWDSVQLAVAGDGQLDMYNVKENTISTVVTLPFTDLVCIRILDNKRVVIAHGEYHNVTCVLYDITTGEQTFLCNQHFAMHTAFVVKGSLIFFNEKKVVRVFDVDRKQVVWTIEGPIDCHVYLSVN